MIDAAQVYDTLILSDVHLGSECSRADDATCLLKQSRFRRLILLGDIFADLNFARLTKEHWRFLGHIRKLSNPKRNVEVVWVEGNHDCGLTNIMSHLVGVKVYQEYQWEYVGIRHLAVHGHQFDRFILNTRRMNYLLTLLYLQLQKLDFKGKPIARFLDRLNTSWLRMSDKVASGAISHARARDAQRIFCGHTHEAMQREQDGILYYNSGGWIDTQLTYVTVDEEGVQIHEYQRQPDFAEERNEMDFEFASELEFAEDIAYASVGS